MSVPTGKRLQRPAPKKKVLKRSEYLAALRRRKPAQRQTFRERYVSAKGKPKARPKRPENLIGPRTAADVRREGRAAAELEFGPAQRTQEAELRGQRAFTTQRLPTLYEQYRAEVQRAGEATQAAYAQAQAESAARQQGVEQQFTADQARRAAESEKMAQITGAGVQAPPEASQASLSRSKAQDAFQSLLGSRRGETASYFGQLGAAGVKRGIESQESSRGREAEIAAKLADLQRQRGAFGVEFKRKARGEERQAAAEAKAFGLDVAQEEAKQKQARFERRAKRRDQSLARRKSNREERKLLSDLESAKTTREKNRADAAIKRYNLKHPNNPISAKGGGKSGKMTPAQKRSLQVKINKAEGQTKATVEAHPEMREKTLKGKKARIQAIRLLKSKYGFSDKRAAGIVKKAVGF